MPTVDAGEFAMPTLLRYPIIAGALFGVLLRIMFSGEGGSPWSAMAGSFIYFAPVVVGMVTVYVADRQRRRTWGYYIKASPTRWHRSCRRHCSSSALCCS